MVFGIIHWFLWLISLEILIFLSFSSCEHFEKSLVGKMPSIVSRDGDVRDMDEERDLGSHESIDIYLSSVSNTVFILYLSYDL